MGYERYPRGGNPQGDYYGRQNPQDYGRDYGAGREGTYSSARDYAAAGEYDRNFDRGGDRGGRDRADQGYRDTGRYGQREPARGGHAGGYDRDSGYYQGSHAHDGRRFADDREDGRGGREQGGYGRPRPGDDRDDRGFLARAGDEVRSWFGDEDAERRRDADERRDQRLGGGRHHDDDYHSWRSGQIAAFDRDYQEYRQENRSKFETEFRNWRTERQGQRDGLNRVTEHMEVIGSDGQHVGTVDKVRGDRIILTKNDQDSSGHHHSIPSRWIRSVDDKVTVSRTADEAKAHWRDEERGALFGEAGEQRQAGQSNEGGAEQERGMLNRSFSGTY